MDQPARNLPAVPEPITRTLSNRLIEREIGGQILVGDDRTLSELAFKTGPEQVEVKGEKRVYQGHDLAKIYVNKALKVVFEIVGLKVEQEPTAEMMKLLVRHVYQAYPHFRVQDVYEAFVQAVAGTFPAKLKHFGQVDMPYFTSVWKAYDKYAYPAALMEKPKMLAQVSPLRDYITHRPEISEAAKGVLLNTYARVVEGQGHGVIQLPDAMWYLLHGFDFADYNDELWAATMEQAVKLVAAHKNRYASRHQTVTIEQVREQFLPACVQEAYRILVGAALLQMKENGIELSMLESELERVSYINPVELYYHWRQQQQR